MACKKGERRNDLANYAPDSQSESFEQLQINLTALTAIVIDMKKQMPSNDEWRGDVK